MPKKTSKTSKSVKKHSSKYGKLAAQTAKDLAAKKKALIHAERVLSKAHEVHSDLIAEVARLDMLDRSLKALIEGTEPPQNVKYVYNYPQWVWYGAPHGWYWYWNGYQYVITNSPNTVIGTNTPNWQGGSTYVYNSGNISGGQNSGGLTGGQTLNLGTAQSNFTMTTSSNGDAPVTFTNTCGLNNDNVGSGVSQPSSLAFTTNSIPSGLESGMTIDLSTNALSIDEVPVEEVEVQPVGVGG